MILVLLSSFNIPKRFLKILSIIFFIIVIFFQYSAVFQKVSVLRDIPVFQRVPVFSCYGILACSSVPVFLFSCVLLFQCFGVPMFWCSNVLVFQLLGMYIPRWLIDSRVSKRVNCWIDLHRQNTDILASFLNKPDIFREKIHGEEGKGAHQDKKTMILFIIKK